MSRIRPLKNFIHLVCGKMRRHLTTLQRRFLASETTQFTQPEKHPKFKIGVLGVAFSKGQGNEGVRKGPQFLRNKGLLQALLKLNTNLKDYGDIVEEDSDPGHHNPVDIKMKNATEVALCNQKVSDKVNEILNTDSKVLVLGGDHSLAMGSVDGHIRNKKDIGLIYVDAHADINTADTSTSGNVHGMAVALMLKELSDYWPYLPGMDWQKPILSVENIAYIGLRDVDEYERVILDKYNITAYGMRDVEKYGITKVTEMALDKVDPKGTRSLHVSFDIDAMDTLEAPSTGVPVRGGLTLREGIHLMELIHNTGRMNVVDIVEINPEIGTKEDVVKTLEAAIHVIKAAFGFSRLGNIPRHVSDIPGHYGPSFMGSDQ